MARGPSTVCVWAGIRSARRCSRCKQAIVWLTRMDTGKSLPFDPAFTVLNTGRDDRSLKFERVSFDDVHKCPKRKRARPAPAAQGRLL